MADRNERTPLLQQRYSDVGESRTVLRLDDFPGDDPREWPRRKKLANVAVIAGMAVLSPLVSSMFTPGISQIADDLNTSTTAVIGTTTGFVVMLGIGPLFLAPLSETFGRRRIYMTCFSIFALLQIPTALAPNIAFLIAVRSIAGFFGSVGIANGGGTISDMFVPTERAGVFGWYLLGPLLGPTLGPLFGGIIIQRLGWRWVFWIMTIVCTVNTLAGYFFLRETYVPAILAAKKAELEKETAEWDGSKYSYEGEDTSSMRRKIFRALTRPVKIFAQPIVATMAVYQALVFGTMYSIFTNMQPIYGEEGYGFDTEKVGLLYLAPGLGSLTAVWFLVPRIDTVYKRLTERNNGKAKPEFRLPLANIGAVLLPISLFWFAWTVEKQVHWFASISSTFFYGIGQVMILNTTQNYYIDSFEKYAASAIAAGTVFRSLVGGVIPLLMPALFDNVGYGWGISTFAFVSLILAPAPMLFFMYGERIRERFMIELE
ncbi:MFS general substrate transporter [Dothidotthia symphoricarpi CBS 119687]|uniref:MFS general substrate transporter n=1 Tax=Dothidotthia symphoricarpi CBS 119687 TaxID=1392245 RepID=A0A6A6ANJ3_9PLEO|nr:MFS general substrate transporter [Dothidotthia symphoricarpi CBS 119687]KAF2132763.1 MFS general substrate transporter [Dothidotthia symphoricarpi CBS 119687]